MSKLSNVMSTITSNKAGAGVGIIAGAAIGYAILGKNRIENSAPHFLIFLSIGFVGAIIGSNVGYKIKTDNWVKEQKKQ